MDNNSQLVYHAAMLVLSSPHRLRKHRTNGGIAMPERPDVLTAEEVAEWLRLSRRTVVRLLETGRLRGTKAGRQWRIERRAVEAFLRGKPRETGESGQ